MYNWTSDVMPAILMTFSSFGYCGQNGVNRAYTYACAVEEMPADYGLFGGVSELKLLS